jgi:hypothetical protein
MHFSNIVCHKSSFCELNKGGDDVPEFVCCAYISELLCSTLDGYLLMTH